jgi:hypothetical protein
MSVDGDQSALAATLVLAASPYFSPPFSAIAPKRRTAALLYLRNAGPTERRPQHPCSRTAATLCRTLPDFDSVRALNIVKLCLRTLPTMIAIAGNHCREWSLKSGKTRSIAASAIAPKRRTAALLYSEASVRRPSMCVSLRTVVRNAG